MKLMWAAYPRRGIKRFMGRCLTLLVALLPVLAAAQQLALNYLTTKDGLGNMAISALAQEPGGALWIGTENGLFRHDGETIRSVDEGSPRSIFSIVFGADGALWVGSRTGLYHRKGGQFVAVPPAGDKAWSVRRGSAALAALPDGGVLAVGIEGKLWRVTANGELLRKELALPGTMVPSKPHALDVRSVLVARDGAWWFGCGDAVCRWHDLQLERWGRAEGVPQAEWLGLMEARDGSIWARSDRHIVRRASGALRFADETPQGLPKGTGYDWLPMSEDQAGRVLTSGDDGVFRWDAGHWRHFGGGNGLTEDGIRAVLPDRDGDVWLGTVGHGLAHWRGYANWSSWSVRQGLPSDAVWSVADDGAGRVWIGTGRGVVSMESSGQQLVREASAVTGQVGHMAADGRGGMWLATFDGAVYHGRTGAPWRLMSGGEKVEVGSMLAVDGVLWIASVQGLFSAPLDGSRPLRRHHELDALVTGVDLRINAVCQAAGSGVIWLGTGSGLLQFDPQRGFVRPQIKGLGASKGVVYLACGAGRVWMRTAIDRQLLRVDIAHTSGLRAELVQSPQINKRQFFSMLEDSRGWLWITTDAGVVRWNGNDWRRFDESNGLAWNDCNQGALAEDAKGSIWVGTSRGVTRIGDPERMKASSPLVLTLSAGTLGHVDLVPGRRMEIPWSTQPLELRWEVPFFTNRQAQHTLYRLRGLDDDWTDIARSDLRYVGLGPGSYSLELVAMNSDLEQRSQPLVLDFEIAPPWWRSTPARAVALAAVLLLIYTGYRTRVRRLMQHQSVLEAQVEERTRDIIERKQLAESLEESQLLLRQLAARNEDAREDERRSLKREIHDELGQHLSALRMGISVVDIQLGRINSPLQEKTHGLIGVVDSTIKVVRHIVTALRPSALELGIVSALEWLAQECSKRTGIQCELCIFAGDLDMGDKHATAVFRIVQESLTNIVRHAQATHVKISLEQKEDHYFLEVRDNGVGFDPARRKETSFGLVSIRERALMLGGKVDISSVPGRTVVRVSFPV